MKWEKDNDVEIYEVLTLVLAVSGLAFSSSVWSDLIFLQTEEIQRACHR